MERFVKYVRSLLCAVSAFCIGTLGVSASVVETGQQPLNKWIVVGLVIAVIVVIIALIPMFKKKK